MILDNESEDEDDELFGFIKKITTKYESKSNSNVNSVSKSFDVEMDNLSGQKAGRKAERKAERKARKDDEQQSNSTSKVTVESETETSSTKLNHSKKFDKKIYLKSKPNLDSKIYSGLKFSSNGILDEFSGLPDSIEEAMRLRRNLTLKQITSIVKYDGMNLFGLTGEIFNVIHDRIQLKVKRHRIKINHQDRVFWVSLYNWYDLKKIEKMIGEIVFG